jgi:glyoxylase-like metal-dependent hydrolase (beta-lactamase superfamily II)
MWRTFAAAAMTIALAPATAVADDAQTVVSGALQAMGATELNAVAYSGSAAMGNFGQSKNISFRLASTAIRNYRLAIDFSRPASQASGDAFPPAVPGGAPPQPRGYSETVSSATPAWAQQFQIWVTPWGFLRGAAANHATVRSRKIDGVEYKAVTWSPAQKAPSGQPYRVTGYINGQQMVELVETWVDHPVMGDLHVETRYTNYQDFGGLKAPTRISQKHAGMETFVVAVNDVRANPSNLGELMSGAPGAGPDGVSAGTGGARPVQSAASTAASERLADGVYRITGGYISLAVEFRDYVVVLEGGQSEARGLAVIAETRRLFPGKRIKYVVNTHPHFDHASGLPPFVAAGISIITDDNNKYFLEAALGSPRTLAGDALAKSHKKPKVEGVIDDLVLKDETRTLELHHVEKLEHSEGMLIAYLPRERILFTADFNAPGPGQAVSPSIATLVQNIERLGLEFDRHVLVHAPNPDRPMTRADLLTLAKETRAPN